MDKDRIVEIGARALAYESWRQSFHDGELPPMPEFCGVFADEWRQCFRAALTAFEEAGLVVVSRADLVDIAHALHGAESRISVGPDGEGQGLAETVQACADDLDAMLAAAKADPQ